MRLKFQVVAFTRFFAFDAYIFAHMFEQSLYDTESVAEPVPVVQDGDLFQHYELKTWVLSPRLYKILGMSAVGNLLAILIFAQTSVLTMKGCDSPLVGSVCQVLDTVYVGSLLFGTKREYVDAAYEHEKLGADDEIIFVELPPESAKLEYPAGYFALANPESTMETVDDMGNIPFPTNIPTYSGIPNVRPMPSNNLLNTPPVYAKPKKDVDDAGLPDGIGDTTASTKKPATNRPNGNNTQTGKNPIDGKNPTGNSNTGGTADDPAKQPPTSDPVTPDINKRPMVDLANNVNDLLEKKQVNLASSFVVNARGKLTKEGRFDPKSFTWGPIASPDEKLKDVIKSAVEAINAAGYLQYLQALSGKDLNMMLQQDEQNISAVMQSEMESDTRATSAKTLLTFALDYAKKTKSGADADQNDKDDLLLLQGATVETDGKRVVIKFVVPKTVALPMIERKLAEQKAAAATPNSNAGIRPNNNTAAR